MYLDIMESATRMLGRLEPGTMLVVFWRRFRSCCLMIVIGLLLLIMGGCMALGWGISRVMAAPNEPGLDVMLILDQSQSLYDLGGVGSDPQLLRMEGARLFASYLGVDGSTADYRLGVVYFGTEAELVVPLTALTDAETRQAVQDALAVPESMGWTDVNAALALAYQELFEGPRAEADRRTAVVVFTDGRPQTEGLGSPAAEQVYMTELHDWIRRFTEHGTAVFTVLLRNSATDADPYIRQVYRPFWVSLAESGMGVRFYDVRTADDLMAVYHDIVLQLHQGQTQGAVVNQAVQQAADVPVEVLSGWRQATFVVRKSDPALVVTIYRPGGQRLEPDDPDVGYTGIPGQSHEEIWSIFEPEAGTWMLQVRGQGTVTAWLDYQPGPPTPTSTSSPTSTATHTPTVALTRTPTQSPTGTATATPTLTATPSPTPSSSATATGTSTPSPTPTAMPRAVYAGELHPPTALEILQPQRGDHYTIGESVPVAVRCSGCAGGIETGLVLANGTGEISLALRSTDQSHWEGKTPHLDGAGTYTVTARPRGTGQAEIVVAVPFEVLAPGLPWIRLLIGGVVILSGGSGWLWWRRRNRALLDGMLRLIQAPQGRATGKRWDLSRLGKSTVTLGWDSRCDVVLNAVPTPPGVGSPTRGANGGLGIEGDIVGQMAQIRAIRSDDRGSQLSFIDLIRDGSVLVNDQPPGRGHYLAHGDVIQIGGYKLRYENVLRRKQGMSQRGNGFVRRRGNESIR